MEFDMFPARGFAHMMIMLMMMTMKMRVLIMMESHLLPAQSLSLLLRCPHHPVLVPLLQAGGANTLHLGHFTLSKISGLGEPLSIFLDNASPTVPLSLQMKVLPFFTGLHLLSRPVPKKVKDIFLLGPK